MSYLKSNHQSLMASLKNVVASRASTKVSLALDIWTSPNFNESFLGGTIHFASEHYKLTTIFTGLSVLPIGHTAEVVKHHTTLLLARFGLTDDDVFNYVTDNASNFVKNWRVIVGLCNLY